MRTQFRTGGGWLVHDDFIIHATLGPWRSDDDAVEEARFFQKQLGQLKAMAPPTQRISSIVDLKNISNWETGPLEMLRIYANMTKDPRTKRVAVVHATPIQKVMIVPLVKLVISNRDKIKFFDDPAAAERWVKM